jgi:hypothetical protein
MNPGRPRTAVSAVILATRLWTTEVPSISLWQPVEIDGLAKGVSFSPGPRYWMRFARVPGGLTR